MATCNDCFHYEACKKIFQIAFKDFTDYTFVKACKLYKPAADVLKENKNEAKWLFFTRPKQSWVVACSHCDYTVATCTPYCPNCGAKMKGDNN